MSVLPGDVLARYGSDLTVAGIHIRRLEATAHVVSLDVRTYTRLTRDLTRETQTEDVAHVGDGRTWSIRHSRRAPMGTTQATLWRRNGYDVAAAHEPTAELLARAQVTDDDALRRAIVADSWPLISATRKRNLREGWAIQRAGGDRP